MLQGSSQKSSCLLFPEYFLSFFLKASRFSSSENSSFFSKTRFPSSLESSRSIRQSTSSMNITRGSRYLPVSYVDCQLRMDESSSRAVILLRRCLLMNNNFISLIGHLHKEGKGRHIPGIKDVADCMPCLLGKQLKILRNGCMNDDMVGFSQVQSTSITVIGWGLVLDAWGYQNGEDWYIEIKFNISSLIPNKNYSQQSNNCITSLLC